jgi:hypothetical protein
MRGLAIRYHRPLLLLRRSRDAGAAIRPSLLKAHHKDLPGRPVRPRKQLARRSAFADQLGVGQFAELRADRLHVDVSVSIFPRIMHREIVARPAWNSLAKSFLRRFRDVPKIWCDLADER